MATVKYNCIQTVLGLGIFLVLFSDLQWKTFTRQQAEADFKMRKESRRDYHKLIYGQSKYPCVCRWSFRSMIYRQSKYTCICRWRKMRDARVIDVEQWENCCSFPQLNTGVCNCTLTNALYRWENSVWLFLLHLLIGSCMPSLKGLPPFLEGECCSVKQGAYLVLT